MSGIVGNKAAMDRARYNLTPDIEARLRIIHVISSPMEGAALTSSKDYAISTGMLIRAFEQIYTRIITVSPRPIGGQRP